MNGCPMNLVRSLTQKWRPQKGVWQIATRGPGQSYRGQRHMSNEPDVFALVPYLALCPGVRSLSAKYQTVAPQACASGDGLSAVNFEQVARRGKSNPSPLQATDPPNFQARPSASIHNHVALHRVSTLPLRPLDATNPNGCK